MRILIVSPDYPEKRGGVSDYTYFLSNALAVHGCDVYLLTSTGSSGRQGSDNITVLPLIEEWGLRGLSRIMRAVPSVSFDWVIFQYVPYMYERHGISINAAVIAFLLKKKASRLMTVFHEVAIRFSLKPKYFVTAFLQRFLAYCIGLLSNQIVITTEFWRRGFRFLESRTSLIPIGSNIVPEPVTAEDIKQCRNLLAPDGQRILATFSAEMTKGSGNPYTRRRLDLIMKAMAESRIRQMELRMIVLGAIQEEVKAATLDLARELGIEDRLIITGFMPAPLLFKVLTAVDALILIEDEETNRYGGISTKSTFAAAAYAAELPLIANTGELTDNFFIDGKNAILITKEQLKPESIAEKVMELFTDADLLHRMKLASRRTYEAELSWDAIGSMYLAKLN